tara:strand:- start:2275 stop:2556 length:282 start_codon:yes stop_codon:yes gene_type:complete
MPKEKKPAKIYVEPESTSYLEYEILGRTTKEGVGYDEHQVTRRKICKGNPEETFETIEVINYQVPHPEPTEEVVVTEPVKEQRRVALGVIPLP